MKDKINADLLIGKIDKEILDLSDAGNEDAWTKAEQLGQVNTVLRRFRDTLIAIAQCQGAVPSHQAQDILAEFGYCDHSKEVYRAAISATAICYTCAKCGRASRERLVPYR